VRLGARAPSRTIASAPSAPVLSAFEKQEVDRVQQVIATVRRSANGIAEFFDREAHKRRRDHDEALRVERYDGKYPRTRWTEYRQADERGDQSAATRVAGDIGLQDDDVRFYYLIRSSLSLTTRGGWP